MILSTFLRDNALKGYVHYFSIFGEENVLKSLKIVKKAFYFI